MPQQVINLSRFRNEQRNWRFLFLFVGQESIKGIPINVFGAYSVVGFAIVQKV
jgi:hypothetical protein